ncbi:MAG: glycosyltransferase [Paludibacteraceae bacterium]|nr:glycosyltransferase [Paludibacteraceae bacterium]
MTVLFLQTAHVKTDDRILHQMQTLRRAGIECVYANRRDEVGEVDVVICDTPKAVLQNVGRKGLLIYDVTEWYPSKKNLRVYHPLLRPLAAVAMSIQSLAAGIVSDRFIFGEEAKSRPFRKLFGWKKFVYLPYYPSKQLFVRAHKQNHVPLNVLYAGPRTAEKGYERAVEVANEVGINLKVISPEQYMPLQEFCTYLQDVDVALDLRDMDAENRRCLPIKLFYYLAAGVVPIYSDLDAIREHIADAEKSVFLVHDAKEAAEALRRLVSDSALWKQYSQRGQQLFDERYYWEKVEERLLQIVK